MNALEFFQSLYVGKKPQTRTAIYAYSDESSDGYRKAGSRLVGYEPEVNPKENAVKVFEAANRVLKSGINFHYRSPMEYVSPSIRIPQLEAWLEANQQDAIDPASFEDENEEDGWSDAAHDAVVLIRQINFMPIDAIKLCWLFKGYPEEYLCWVEDIKNS